MKTPRVSVLMPVYNGEQHLATALESILAQTFEDFEFLIINDGSTDETDTILRSYTDPRIQIIENEQNLGLIESLNRGLDMAKGEYVARMDSDDISLPTRLATQVAFMDAHPDIGVCGAWIRIMGERDVAKYFADPEDIAASLLFTTSLAHPSVMLRQSVLREFGLRYDESYPHSEDYALWCALSQHTKLANIPRILLEYRVHAKSVSHEEIESQRDGASRIRLAQLHALGLQPTPDQVRLHNTVHPKAGENVSSFLHASEAWLLSIRDANEKKPTYARASLARVLYERWRALCSLNAAADPSVAAIFISSPLFRFGSGKRYLDALKIAIRGF